MIKSSVVAAATFPFLLLSVAPAPAQTAARAWVSGHGADSAGCGALASPCRSFQYVHDNIVAAGGEIDVLDAGGYGAVTITKALSIVNDGVGTAGVQATSGHNAVTITAGASDSVYLRGLTIDGLGIGDNGVYLESAGALTIVDCAVRHFAFEGNQSSGNGILIQPSSSLNFVISHTILSDNGGSGLAYLPSSGPLTAKGNMDRVTTTGNRTGFSFATETDPDGSASLAVSNSVASNNSGYGFSIAGLAAQLGNSNLFVSIDNSSATGNGNSGVAAADGVIVLLGRTVIAWNGVYGVDNATSSNTLYSYGDNRINGNRTDVHGGVNTTYKPQ